MSATPLGILGSIFDPVHNGHLAVANLAVEYFKLQEIIFIPAGLPPHKNSSVHASAQDRLNMLEIALKDFNRAQICKEELARDGLSYTIDTLHLLRGKYPNRPLYFVIGSDNLPQICTWKNFREIIAMVTLCVASRPGFDLNIPSELCDAEIKHFPSPEWGLSSSGIRSFFKQGYSCRYMVPDAVLEYIRRNNLYATT